MQKHVELWQAIEDRLQGAPESTTERSTCYEDLLQVERSWYHTRWQFSLWGINYSGTLVQVRRVKDDTQDRVLFTIQLDEPFEGLEALIVDFTRCEPVEDE